MILFGVVLIVDRRADAVSRLGRGVDPDRNPLVRLTRRLMPVTTDFHGKHFFVRIDGRWHATPLFLALMAIEMSDIVFAIDSVPAIFALTSEPLIVFTSNVFAILGLRSLYFVLAAAVAQVHAAALRAGRRADLHRPEDDRGSIPFPITLVAGDHRGAGRRLDRRLADRRRRA